MVALKPKSERNEHDLYETPEWVVDEFLNLVPIREDWKYLEPCRASGRFYNHMPIGSAWAEIREGVDYLNTQYNPVDCILTNPPFSLAQEFVEKARTEADVVIMLLRVGFLGSIRRKEFWSKNPPSAMITLSKRPSFTDNGKTDGAEYAFFIWDDKNRLGLDRSFYWISP